MELITVEIQKPEDINFILGQSHFIKTVEDIHVTLINAVPSILFGVAFCEASDPALICFSGTSDAMIDLAKTNALNIAAGHSFIIFLENCFPLNVLNAIKQVPEVCGIYCASANPVEVIVAESQQGRGI